MKCTICRHGDTRPGHATVTLEREGATVVFRRVPAEICDNCGEEYVGEETAHELLTAFESAIRTGIVVDVRLFTAA